MKELKTNPRNL